MATEILTEVLSQLKLSVRVNQLVTQLTLNSYADPELLCELFEADGSPLLADLKTCCLLSDSDFTILKAGYVSAYRETAQQRRPPAAVSLPRLTATQYFSQLQENELRPSEVACVSREVPKSPERKNKFRLTDKEADLLLTPKHKVGAIERPVESDDETAARRERIKATENVESLRVNRVVQNLLEKDKLHELEVLERSKKYVERVLANQETFFMAPELQEAAQNRIMIRNIQTTIEEFRVENPTAEVPQYEEIFPKPEKTPVKVPKVIPDFAEAPVFHFKEPPPLPNLEAITRTSDSAQMQRKSQSSLVVDLDGDDEPQQVQPRQVSSSTVNMRASSDSFDFSGIPANSANNGNSYFWRGTRFRQYAPGEYLNRIPQHDPETAKKCRIDLSKEFPKDPESRYETWARRKRLDNPVRKKNLKVADVDVSNYIRKPTQRKRQATQGVVDLGDDDSLVPDNRKKPKKNPLGRDYSFDTLGESDALQEKNKDKNFDGKKIRGLAAGSSRFTSMVTQPVEDSECYNKTGRQRHEIVPFTDAQHKRQLDFAKYSTPFKASYLQDEPLIDDGQEKDIDLNALMFKKELSYYELMKAIVDCRMFRSIAEVRTLVTLTERSGLKMIEWSTRQADNLIMFKCKKYPKCHAQLNFEINHALTGRPKLHSSRLKHLHPPDWTEKTQIKREVWAVLTYPTMQQKLKCARDQFRSMDELYYIAEEYAIVESLDFSAVTEEEFTKFYQLYINTTRIDTPYDKVMGREIHPRQHLNKRDKKMLEKQVSQLHSTMSQSQTTLPQQTQAAADAEASLHSTAREGEDKPSDVDQIEIFYQNTTEQVRPIAPNRQAQKIQAQLVKQFGEDLVIHCSNDEAMLFFTFKEQVDQAADFMTKPGGGTMLILGGFKTQMSGMNLLLFVTQAQSTMHFILVAGCLIIEDIAVGNSSFQTIDYSWIFSVYAASKLPIPSVCLTEFNDGLYKALRASWPKVLHGWSALSVLRKGEQSLVSDNADEAADPALLNALTRFIRNHTKTRAVFKAKYAELLDSAMQARHKPFMAFLKEIKLQKMKWARFALAWELDEFYNNQHLFYGDLILLQKQRYIQKVVQRIITRQQGLRLNQVIRAFEYLSTFGYHNGVFTRQTGDPFRLKTELHVSQSCVNLVLANIGEYMAQKLINMAAKCATYHVQSHELDVYQVRQTSEPLPDDGDDSCRSADSDMFSSPVLEVCWSGIDKAFHCECNSVRLLGYVCVHILRVVSFRKQKVECLKNFAVQYEDIRSYFAAHVAKPPKEDLISFDVTNPTTLDREKHPLADLLLTETKKQLPPMNRETIFSELAQKIKVDKLMNYKPKHKAFENPEIEIADGPMPPTLFEAFSFKAQIKLSNGDQKGSYSATDCFLILLQDLISKKLVENSCVTEMVRENLTKAVHALRKKKFELAQSFAYKTLDPTQKKKQFELILMATLDASMFAFQTNRSCKKQVSALLILQSPTEDVEKAINDQLHACTCRECPTDSLIKSSPPLFFVKLNQDSPATVKSSIVVAGQLYDLQTVVTSHKSRLQEVSLLMKEPAVVAQRLSALPKDAYWPGWFFYSSHNKKKSASFQFLGEDSYEGGYAHAVTRHQLARLFAPRGVKPSECATILCYVQSKPLEEDHLMHF